MKFESAKSTQAAVLRQQIFSFDKQSSGAGAFMVPSVIGPLAGAGMGLQAAALHAGGGVGGIGGVGGGIAGVGMQNQLTRGALVDYTAAVLTQY